MRRRGGARRDDALAGAVGIILILAVVLTTYATSVRHDLPIYGEEVEHNWDGSVRVAFDVLARNIGATVGTGTTTSATLPRAPPARLVEIPFIGGAAPLPPDGSVRLEPSCAGVHATHKRTGNQTVTDLAGITTGCIIFQATPAYGRPFGYAYELGGVLYLQDGQAVVISGPSIALENSTSQLYRVSLTMPGLRGSAVSASAGTADVRVDITAGPAAGEGPQEPNAGNVTWSFNTTHPAAWKTWFERRFLDAGFVPARTPLAGQSAADHSVVCVPADCSLNSTGQGQLVVTMEGPRVDTQDIQLSVTFGIIRVGIG